jgi:kynurenine formamidase
MTAAKQSPRWKKRPEGSNWGDFGPDDQIGRLNLLTPEKVLQGVAEVKAGRKFCLSLPLDYPGGMVLHPRRRPPQLRPIMHGDDPFFAYALNQWDKRYTDVACDDTALISLQYSTQWDSLAHVGQLFDANDDGTPEKVFYNGYRAGIEILPPGSDPEAPEATAARALGIETMAETCVQGRGVLVDLHKHFGRAHKSVNYDDLRRVLDADRVEVESGDMMCFHTGFGEMLMEAKGKPGPELHHACSALDGRDQRLLKWVADNNIVAMIADNLGVESIPAGDCSDEHHAYLPLHELCLFKLGIPLGELWYLTGLANWLREHERSRFLLTAPPLRLPGAVGSPANAIATV